ncbi:hypothetical protein GLYMA_04G078151v4 [Glycine max]|nr:hypothetical protein GLYMA_04G078151v4 [Glycine max]KAH1110332.1 hypothetical protein GYH30_009274 [Glycine max]
MLLRRRFLLLFSLLGFARFHFFPNYTAQHRNFPILASARKEFYSTRR